MAKIKGPMVAKAGAKISGGAVIEIIDNVIKLANSLVNAYKDIKVEQEKTLQFKIKLENELKCEREHTQQIKIEETNKTIRSLAKMETRLESLKIESEMKLKKLEADREREHEEFLLRYKLAEKLLEPMDIFMEQWKKANDNIYIMLGEDNCDLAKLQRMKSYINDLGTKITNMMAELRNISNSNKC